MSNSNRKTSPFLIRWFGGNPLLCPKWQLGFSKSLFLTKIFVVDNKTLIVLESNEVMSSNNLLFLSCSGRGESNF